MEQVQLPDGYETLQREVTFNPFLTHLLEISQILAKACKGFAVTAFCS